MDRRAPLKYALTCTHIYVTFGIESESELFRVGDFERERWRGPPGLPGVLPSGERAVAQPDSEAAPGGVRRRERAQERGCDDRHHTVPGAGGTPLLC